MKNFVRASTAKESAIDRQATLSARVAHEERHKRGRPFAFGGVKITADRWSRARAKSIRDGGSVFSAGFYNNKQIIARAGERESGGRGQPGA